MAEFQYINELPAIKVIKKNINGEAIYSKENYKLLLPHLSPEFRNNGQNYVGVFCFPPFPGPTEAANHVYEHITSNIKDSSTKIIFDNVYEGHVRPCIHGIHQVINHLNLDHKNCYFVTAGLQANQIYDQYCQEYGITEKINIIVLNSWERHIQLSTKRNDLHYKFNYFIGAKQKTFLCFNRILRAHRIALLGLLYERNLVDGAYYSFFQDLRWDGRGSHWSEWIQHELSTSLRDRVTYSLKQQEHKFPLLLNNGDGSNTNSVLHSDIELYRNSYFSLITETFFFKILNNYWDESSVFFSEKVFKPIACRHPFIIVSRPRSLEYLRKMGYKTFHPFINESYDSIDDDEVRLNAIVDEVQRLSNQSSDQWINWLMNVAMIVEHNQKTLFNKGRDSFQFVG